MYFFLYIFYIYELQVVPPSYGSYFLKEAIQHAFVQTITPTSKQCEEETITHHITSRYVCHLNVLVQFSHQTTS